MSKKNIHLELESIKEPLKQVSVLAICSIIKKHFKFLGAQPIASLSDLIPIIPNNIDKDILSEIETLKDEEVLDTINNILKKCDLEDIKNYIDRIEITKSNSRVAIPLLKLAHKILSEVDGTNFINLSSEGGNIETELLAINKDINITSIDNVQNIAKEDASYQYLKLLVKLKHYINSLDCEYLIKDIISQPIVTEKDSEMLFDKGCVIVPLKTVFNKSILESVNDDIEKLGIRVEKTVSAGWFYILKLLTVLKENKKAVAIVPNSTLVNYADEDIRQALVDKGYIEAIVKVPVNHYGIVVLNKVKKDAKKQKTVKFIDLSDAVSLDNDVQKFDSKKACELYNDSLKTFNVEITELESKSYSLKLEDYKKTEESSNGQLLGEIATITRGCQFTSKELEQMQEPDKQSSRYQLLEINNISNDGSIEGELKVIYSKKKDLSKYLLQNGDIVISAKGNNVKKAIVKINDGDSIIASGNLLVIRLDSSLNIKPEYLKLFLDSEKGMNLIDELKVGAIIPVISVQALRKMPTPIDTNKEGYEAKQNRIIQQYQDKLKELQLAKDVVKQIEKEMQDLASTI